MNKEQQRQQLFQEIRDTVPLYGNTCSQCAGPLAVIYRRRPYPFGEFLYCSRECDMEWTFELRRRHRFLIPEPQQVSMDYVFK